MDPKHEAPVLVYRGGGGPPRADVFRSVLEGSGIHAYATMSGMSGAYPTTVGAMGEFEIYVQSQDAERAREILAAAEEDLPDMELDEDFDVDAEGPDVEES